MVQRFSGGVEHCDSYIHFVRDKPKICSNHLCAVQCRSTNKSQVPSLSTSTSITSGHLHSHSHLFRCIHFVVCPVSERTAVGTQHNSCGSRVPGCNCRVENFLPASKNSWSVNHRSLVQAIFLPRTRLADPSSILFPSRCVATLRGARTLC